MTPITSQQSTTDELSAGLAGSLSVNRQGLNAEDISRVSGKIANEVSGSLTSDPDFRRLVDKPANLRMVNNIKVDSQPTSLLESMKASITSLASRFTPEEEKSAKGISGVIEGLSNTNSILNDLLKKPSRLNEASDIFDERLKRLNQISSIIGKNVGDLLLAKEIAKYAHQALQFKENYKTLLNLSSEHALQVREMRVHFAGVGEDITGTGKLFSNEFDTVNKTILETSGYLGASFGDVNAIMNTILSGGNLIGKNQKELVDIVKVSREMAALFGMSDEEAAGLSSNMLTMGKSVGDIRNLNKAILVFGKSLGLTSGQMGDVLKATERWTTLSGRFGKPEEQKKVAEGFSKVTTLAKMMNLDISGQMENTLKNLTETQNAATQVLYQRIGRGNTELGAKLAKEDPVRLMQARYESGITRMIGFVQGDTSRLFNLTEHQRAALLSNLQTDIQQFSAEESGSLLIAVQKFLSKRKDLIGASSSVIMEEMSKHLIESEKMPVHLENYQKSLEAFRGTIGEIFEDIGKAFDSLKVTIAQPILNAVLPALEGLRNVIRSISKYAQENAEVLRTVGKAVMAFAMISFFRIDKLLYLTRMYKSLGVAIKGISGTVPIVGRFVTFVSAAGSQLAVLGTAAYGFLKQIPIVGGVVQKVLGPVIFLINSKLVKALLMFSSVFANVIGGMQLALIGFSKVLFSFQFLNPAFWLAWSVVAVGALMYYTGFLDTLYQVFKDNANVIRQAFWDPIVTVWGEVKDIFKSIINEIVSFFQVTGGLAASSGLVNFFGEVNLSVSKVMAAISVLAANMAGGLIGGLLKGVKAFLIFIKTVVFGILYLASTVREFFTGAQGYSDAYNILFKSGLEKTKQALIDFVKTMLTGPLVAAKKVIEYLFGAGSADFMDKWINNVNRLVDDGFTGLVTVLGLLKERMVFLYPAFDVLGTVFSALFNSFKSGYKEISDFIEKIGGIRDIIHHSVIEDIGGIITHSTWDEVGSISYEKILLILKKVGSVFVEKVFGLGEVIIRKIGADDFILRAFGVNNLSEVAGKIQSAISAIKSKVSGYLEGAGNFLSQFFGVGGTGDLIGPIRSSVSKVLNFIKESFSINTSLSFVESLKSVDWKKGFLSLFDYFKSIDWKGKLLGLIEYIKSIDWLSGIKNIAKSIKGSGWLKSVSDWFLNAFQSVKEKLSSGEFWSWVVVGLAGVLPVVLALLSKISSFFTGGAAKTAFFGAFTFLYKAFISFGNWLIIHGPSILRKAVTGMIKAIRLLFSGTMSVMSRFFPAFTALVVTKLGIISTAIRSFFVLSNPYLWIAVAVGSLLYYLGFFDALWVELKKYNWKELFQPLVDAFKGTGGADGGILESIRTIFKELKDVLAPLIPILAQIVTGIALFIAYAAAPVLIGAFKVIGGVLKGVAGLIGLVVGVLSFIVSGIVVAIRSVGEAIGTFFGALSSGKDIGEALSEAWNTFTSRFSEMWTKVQNTLGPFIAKSLVWLLKSLPDILKGVGTILLGLFSALVKTTFKLAGWDYDAFIMKVSDWIEVIANWLGKVVEFFSSWEGFKSGLASIGDYLWEKLKAAGSWVAESISNAILKAVPESFAGIDLLTEEQKTRKRQLLAQERLEELTPEMQKLGMSKDLQGLISGMMEKTGSRDYEGVVKATSGLGKDRRDWILKAMSEAGNIISDPAIMIGMVKDWANYAKKIGLDDNLAKVGIGYLIQKGESSYKNGMEAMDQIKRVADLNKGVGLDTQQLSLAAIRNLQEGGGYIFDSTILKGLKSLKQGKSFDTDILDWTESEKQLTDRNDAALKLLSTIPSLNNLVTATAPPSAATVPMQSVPIPVDKMRTINEVMPSLISLAGPAPVGGNTVAELDQGTVNAINKIADSLKVDSAQRAEFIKLVKIKWLGQKAYGSGEVDALVRAGVA